MKRLYTSISSINRRYFKQKAGYTEDPQGHHDARSHLARHPAVCTAVFDLKKKQTRNRERESEKSRRRGRIRRGRTKNNLLKNK